jgi:tetratricopeptide (TPR) repeat protein
MQEYDLALEDYNTSIELDKERSISYFNRGLFYAIMTKKNIDKGIDDFDQAIKLDSLQIDYYTYRAFAYQLIENYDRAISDLEKAIETDPANFQAAKTLSNIYSATGNTEKYKELSIWSDFSHVAFNSNSIIYSDDVSKIIQSEIDS